MVTLSYFTEIDAPAEKIWKVLWSSETYLHWHSLLSQTLELKSDWKVGGKTEFLETPKNGLFSTISNLDIPNYVTFNHLGVLKNGFPEINTRKIKEWSGAPERYLLIPLEHGKIRLQVEVRDFQDRREKMDDAYPKALAVIKELSETRH